MLAVHAAGWKAHPPPPHLKGNLPWQTLPLLGAWLHARALVAHVPSPQSTGSVGAHVRDDGQSETLLMQSWPPTLLPGHATKPDAAQLSGGGQEVFAAAQLPSGHTAAPAAHVKAVGQVAGSAVHSPVAQVHWPGRLQPAGSSTAAGHSLPTTQGPCSRSVGQYVKPVGHCRIREPMAAAVVAAAADVGV